MFKKNSTFKVNNIGIEQSEKLRQSKLDKKSKNVHGKKTLVKKELKCSQDFICAKQDTMDFEVDISASVNGKSASVSEKKLLQKVQESKLLQLSNVEGKTANIYEMKTVNHGSKCSSGFVSGNHDTVNSEAGTSTSVAEKKEVNKLHQNKPQDNQRSYAAVVNQNKNPRNESQDMTMERRDDLFRILIDDDESSIGDEKHEMLDSFRQHDFQLVNEKFNKSIPILLFDSFKSFYSDRSLILAVTNSRGDLFGFPVTAFYDLLEIEDLWEEIDQVLFLPNRRYLAVKFKSMIQKNRFKNTHNVLEDKILVFINMDRKMQMEGTIKNCHEGLTIADMNKILGRFGRIMDFHYIQDRRSNFKARTNTGVFKIELLNDCSPMDVPNIIKTNTVPMFVSLKGVPAQCLVCLERGHLARACPLRICQSCGQRKFRGHSCEMSGQSGVKGAVLFKSNNYNQVKTPINRLIDFNEDESCSHFDRPDLKKKVISHFDDLSLLDFDSNVNNDVLTDVMHNETEDLLKETEKTQVLIGIGNAKDGMETDCTSDAESSVIGELVPWEEDQQSEIHEMIEVGELVIKSPRSKRRNRKRKNANGQTIVDELQIVENSKEKKVNKKSRSNGDKQKMAKNDAIQLFVLDRGTLITDDESSNTSGTLLPESEIIDSECIADEIDERQISTADRQEKE